MQRARSSSLELTREGTILFLGGATSSSHTPAGTEPRQEQGVVLEPHHGVLAIHVHGNHPPVARQVGVLDPLGTRTRGVFEFLTGLWSQQRTGCLWLRVDGRGEAGGGPSGIRRRGRAVAGTGCQRP